MRSSAFALLIILPSAATIASAQTPLPARCTVDHKPLSEALPVVVWQGSLLVKARPFVEALGARMVYHPAEGKLEVRRGEDRLELWMGTPVAHVNHVPVQLAVAPRMVSGAAYLPLRLTTRALGATAVWNARSKTLSLTRVECGG